MQARMWSLLYKYTSKCEISKALNLTFSAVWRNLLSEEKIKECAEINQLHWAGFIECNGNKSEDDNGSWAVFDDVDCFRSQGWDNVIIFDQVLINYGAFNKQLQKVENPVSFNNFQNLTFA